MIESAYKRYCAVCEARRTDPEYLALEARLKEHEPRFQGVTQCLTPQQQEVIIEYIGLCGELGERAIEIACFTLGTKA